MSNNTTVNPPFVSFPVALSFNGSSSYVDLGNDAALNITGPITLQAWILPRKMQGLCNILAHGYTLNPNAEVYFRIVNGKYQVGSWNGSDHFTESPIPEGDFNSWVHLCGVYDGSKWILYRNGLQVASSNDATGAVSVNGPWAIGARGDGTSRFFNGLIRNVAIWKTARTATEVAKDMYTYPVGSENENNLAGYWSLDQGEGNEAYDSSTNNDSGQIQNASWYVPNPKAADTLVLPGEPQNGYVDLGNPAKLNFAGPITIMAWIMPHKTNGLRNILAHGYTLNPHAEVYFRVNNGKYQIGSWNGSDHFVEYAIPQEDMMNWVHLTGVYDGHQWLLYRNGVKVAAKADTTGAVEVSANWAMGARGDGTSRFIASCIKEVAIWSKGLSAEEIQSCIHKGMNGTETSLAAYWPLNEGAGKEVFDRTTSPANGTLKKAGWYNMPDLPGWFEATANGQFRNMNIPVTLAMGRRIWTMAGQYQSAVYASFDGINWETITSKAPWAGRRSSAGLVYGGKMWLFGGDSVEGDKNDVWSSIDGENWTEVNGAAAWAPRNGLCALVFAGKMWIMGGGDHAGHVYNDVWNSTDGVTWTKVTAHAAWSPRDSAGAAVFNNRMWLCGGAYGGNSKAEVWSSSDGATWQKSATPPWASRFGAKVEALAGKLYVMGGTNTQTRGLSDVWCSSDGQNWTELMATAPWAPRGQLGTTVFNNRIYLLGGIVNRYSNSAVWYWVPVRPMSTTDTMINPQHN